MRHPKWQFMILSTILFQKKNEANDFLKRTIVKDIEWVNSLDNSVRVLTAHTHSSVVKSTPHVTLFILRTFLKIADSLAFSNAQKMALTFIIGVTNPFKSVHNCFIQYHRIEYVYLFKSKPSDANNEYTKFFFSFSRRGKKHFFSHLTVG